MLAYAVEVLSANVVTRVRGPMQGEDRHPMAHRHTTEAPHWSRRQGLHQVAFDLLSDQGVTFIRSTWVVGAAAHQVMVTSDWLGAHYA